MLAVKFSLLNKHWKNLSLVKKRILILVFFVSIIFNIVVISIYFINPSFFGINQSFKAEQAKFPLLSGSILQDSSNDVLINFLDLRQSIKDKTASYGDKFGIYFEYLPTGTSIGVNSASEFYAASLFKLPVVMAYFRHKERTGMKSKQVSIRLDQIDTRFGDLWQKGVGYKINLDDAARIAIIDSDNTAAKVLGPYIDEQDFQDVYDAIDINLQITDKGAVLTAKNYSSILKSLYFSAVLSKEDSETILSYLTESKFNDKLIAGVPNGITVAHKIGVIENESYTDCGIVYLPHRPYMLCMISVSDEKTARERMRDLSKTIYDFVSSANVPTKK